MIIFVVQRGDCSSFAPYRINDPVFADLLDEAVRCGVVVKVVYTAVDESGIHLRSIDHIVAYWGECFACISI